MTANDRTEPGVCPECKGAGSMFEGSSGLDAKVCRICKGTGQQPAQPATDERGRPMTYWGGQPAQPDYDPIAAVEAVEHYEASAKALDALDAQPESGEALPRIGLQWNGPRDFVCTPMPDGYWTPWHIAHEVLTAAQQRIAALHASLRTYGWHKPECDYMQDELPCTCGFMDAIKGRDIGPLPGGEG